MSSGITVSPAFQEVTLFATQSATVAEVTFFNETDQDVILEPLIGELQLETLEGLPQMEYIPKQTGQSLSYAKLLTKNVTLAPQQSTKVQVSIENNDALSPGGHYFTFVVPMKLAKQDTATERLIPTLTSTVFLTKKSGANYHINLVDVQTPKIQFGAPKLELTYENVGNTHAVPYGKVTGRDIFRREVFSGIINEDSYRIFPIQDRTLVVKMKRPALALPISWYRLEIDGRVLPGDEKYNGEVSTLVVLPLQLCLWVVVISVAVFIIWEKLPQLRLWISERKKRQFERL